MKSIHPELLPLVETFTDQVDPRVVGEDSESLQWACVQYILASLLLASATGDLESLAVYIRTYTTARRETLAAMRDMEAPKISPN